MIDYAVYAHIDKEGRCLYVGMTRDIKTRTTSHMSTSPWWNEISEIKTIPCDSKMQATHKERECIRNMAPIHNRQYAGLPSDEQLEDLHFVFTPNKLYDSVKNFFGFSSEDELIALFGITKHHVTLVRLGYMNQSAEELRYLSDLLLCNVTDINAAMRRKGNYHAYL